MHSKKVSKTKYDDLGKLMKQTSFTVKKPGRGGRNLPKKQSTIIKKKVSDLVQNRCP